MYLVTITDVFNKTRDTSKANPTLEPAPVNKKKDHHIFSNKNINYQSMMN